MQCPGRPIESLSMVCLIVTVWSTPILNFALEASQKVFGNAHGTSPPSESDLLEEGTTYSTLLAQVPAVYHGPTIPETSTVSIIISSSQYT